MPYFVPNVKHVCMSVLGRLAAASICVCAANFEFLVRFGNGLYLAVCVEIVCAGIVCFVRSPTCWCLNPRR